MAVRGYKRYVMPKPERPFRCPPRSAIWRIAWLLVGIFAGGGRVPVRAHDFFAGYIQHRVEVTMGARDVDVTVQLTFFEESSTHEREHMDANGDGRLSLAETETYLKALAPKLTPAVRLRIGDAPVALTELYAPELDLLDNDRVTFAHHQLMLHLFGRTPTRLTAGASIVVEDRLWPGGRALGTLQVRGQDGCRLEALPQSDPVFPPARDGEARQFKARVQAPPRLANEKPDAAPAAKP